MAKPHSKTTLLTASQTQYNELLALIQSAEKQGKQTFPKGTMNRNIRDVLDHLHQWHLLFLNWYEIGMQGKKPFMPAKGYTWRTTPELNQAIWKAAQLRSLDEVKTDLDMSYQSLQNIIKAHTDETLFTKKYYAWTGSTSLGAYLISNTSSHYAWAYKLIKKALNL